MDNEFNTAKANFKEVIEKLIEMNWITVDEHISIDGIASQFANKLNDMNRDQLARELMGKLIYLKRIHPDIFKIIKNLVEE